MTDTTTRPPIEVGLIADLACPWCYLGLVRLDHARAMRPHLPVCLRWRPFFLNPHMPPEGMDRQAYLRAKFGGDATAKGIYERIVTSGRADGVAFAFERMTRTPNTLLAHRLILFADQQGQAEAVIRALFQALFVDGRDIGSCEELTEIGAAATLDRVAVASLLAGDLFRSEVVAAHREAERLGVNGVPVFVVDDQHVIAGAQPAEVLVGLLDLAGSAREPADAQQQDARSAVAAVG
ncbi:MAG TPA: DsbA family oxidoreductase [Geminicoccaceae bacterium]|nr:DsbA family oxidoreductase [Geminicoccaceae bacterium]